MIISEMQSKLASWSTEDNERKFNRLLRLIASESWLKEATRITLASSGAKTPGIDGINKRKFELNLEDELKLIKKELLSGQYQPLPARRIYIPKPNGKQRPLGIPTLRDRIVQRAMLMAMEPIWESDFHRQSYGFRPERSVHHAIRVVRVQLQDKAYTAGRWVIEGDLKSYFDTVHHKLLMKFIKKRICDQRFLSLLWSFLKSGHIDKGIFRSASTGVPQGGVLSPLLSNIMLNEFDQFLERKYLCRKVRRHREIWNRSIQDQIPIAVRENRKWIPAVSYCRYADDFVLVLKGNREHARIVREDCREFLENDLLLTLNMEKTHITHVNDGFIFLGHRIIRKRGPSGGMRPVTSIPHEKFRNFAAKIVKDLSTNYSMSKVDMIKRLNRKLSGWANFYKYTDFTAIIFGKVDGVIFWKLGYWLARKYRTSIKSLMIRWFKFPGKGKAKTWHCFETDKVGKRIGMALRRLVSSPKGQFRWKTPEQNPYLPKEEERRTITSRYNEIAMAFSHS